MKMVLRYKQLTFNSNYYISNKGFVISLIRGFSLLKPRYNKQGYVRYCIRNKETGKRKDYKAHRLVAEYFIEKEEGKDEVNHIDGNKTNNHVENLEWCNRQENVQHSYDNDLNHSKKCPILCTTNGKVYDSQLEASIDLNISRKSIKNVLDKKQYISKGFHFEYVDKNWRDSD